MTNAVVFNTEKWGFNKDEVCEYITQLCNERDEYYEKYQALMKKHKKLKERLNDLENSK